MVGATQGECSFVRTESTLNSVITLQSYSGSFKDLICHSIPNCSFLDFFFLSRLFILEFFLGGDTLIFNIQIKKKKIEAGNASSVEDQGSTTQGTLVQFPVLDWGGGGKAREQIK